MCQTSNGCPCRYGHTHYYKANSRRGLPGKCGEEKEECVGQAEVHGSTQYLKLFPQPTLNFLSLTETNERPYVGAIYLWRGLGVRTVST